MIKEVRLSLFDTGADVLVNPINCQGAMGAGLALEFKRRYPAMYRDYQVRCNAGKVRIGRPYLWAGEDVKVLNFPTKDQWRYPSQLIWIEQGLVYFAKHHEWLKTTHGIQSIAFPHLGCGKGGLRWEDVRPLMYKHLGSLDLTVIVCS